LPQGTRSSRGRKLSDFIKLDEGEEIAAVLPVESYEAERELVIVTSQGQVKRTPLAEYANIRSGGIIATGLAGSDRVLAAFLTRGQAEIFMATRLGQSIRFREEEVRSMGRTARGVKGIDLARTDLVVSALAPRRDAELLIATTRGYGKRVPFTEMKLQGRAGKGIGILPERDKAGQLIGVLEVLSDDRVMWETEGGALVETGVSKARVRSRRGTSVPVAGLPEDARSFASVRPVRTATRAAAAESEGTAGTGEPTGSEGAESDPQPSGPAGRFAQAELELPEE
jgi:DNA gyrase subunit A